MPAKTTKRTIHYKSAIARGKRILVGAGFPWSTKTGRYSPFCNTQRVTHGVKLSRVGYSETIALHVHWSGTYSAASRDHDRMIFALAIQALREAGLPFDDRGWLECGRDAR